MNKGFSLRPYQEQAVTFVLEAFSKRGKVGEQEDGSSPTPQDIALADSSRSALIVLPTGCGKTIVFANIIKQEIDNGGRVLVLAHRNKLLEQAHDKLQFSCEIDASYEGKAGGDGRVVICSIQSMCKDNRLEKYEPDSFSLIVVDETHHITSPSYQKVVEYFYEANVVGVTATPVRGDGHDTREDFDVVAPEYTTDLAIREGYLCPVSVAKIPINIDISSVHMQGGDYSASEVASVLDRSLLQIAKKTAKLTAGRKTVIFTPLVRTAQRLAELFNTKTDVKADYVSGERKDSDDVLDSFRNGGISVITNAMLITEGWDEPSVECVINLRPTRSRSLYIQMIGRGLRLHPGKERATVLDFLWQDNGRGRLSAQDVLVDVDDPYARKRMRRAFDDLEEGEEIDIYAMKEKAERDAIAAREAALADALKAASDKAAGMSEARKSLLRQLTEYAAKKSICTGVAPIDLYAESWHNDNRKIRVRYHCISANLVAAHVYDPVLEALCIARYDAKLDGEWEQDPPTVRQLSALEKFGIPVEYAVNKGHASFLINGFINRSKEGMGTYKQIKALLKMGYTGAANFTREQCKKAFAARGGTKKAG